MNGVGIAVQAALTPWSMVRKPVPVSLENESRHFRPGTTRSLSHVPRHDPSGARSPSPYTRRGTRRGLPPASDGKVCSSGERSVITQPAWLTVQEQKLRSWQRQTMSAAGDRMAEGIVEG